MKPVFRIFIILLAAALAAAAVSCRRRSDSPVPTDVPATEAPEDEAFISYTSERRAGFWPEGADAEDFDYACFAAVPVFDDSDTAGAAMNKAVEAYLADLGSRIENQYMPSATAEEPISEVAFEVSFANGFANCVFSEKHGLSDEPVTETHTVVLDRRGNEADLRDVFCDYHADAAAAKAIFGIISEHGEGLYDADEVRILGAIDTAHRIIATKEGCAVFFPAGTLAPAENGELAFELTFADMLGDKIGESGFGSFAAYRSALELLRFAANSVVLRGETIENGMLSPYAAGQFMTQLASKLGVQSTAGRREFSSAEFDRLYRACFGEAFPGADGESSVRIEGDSVSVSVLGPKTVCNVDVISVARSGNELAVTGDLMSGAFGDRNSEYSCHAEILLVENSESPFGFTLRDLKLFD